MALLVTAIFWVQGEHVPREFRLGNSKVLDAGTKWRLCSDAADTRAIGSTEGKLDVMPKRQSG